MESTSTFSPEVTMPSLNFFQIAMWSFHTSIALVLFYVVTVFFQSPKR
jgi:hypothetical protein